ncbi:unnamed protein product [Prorocentrum cordatum]|uniref:Exostosin GT47 domain-containing protein n=1 Tax=Prorocentrum cordatum TaxID=2364126 RepID=A0ABN9VNC2_9DINO|nr:unnamed protein product [Polarella glacialis]
MAWPRPRVYVHGVPACAAAPALLDRLPGDGGRLLRPDDQANALYVRKIAAQLRPLHRQLADLFYIPAFFSILFWLGTADALSCVAKTVRSLQAHPYFTRRSGRDHFVIYGAEFPHYRDEPQFGLEHYEATASRWVILTVACPRPCGAQLDAWSARGRFVVVPHASRLRCRPGGGAGGRQRRFLLGFVGSRGAAGRYPEREAFFGATCAGPRWLRTEDGLWHRSRPWTARHWVLDGNTPSWTPSCFRRRPSPSCARRRRGGAARAGGPRSTSGGWRPSGAGGCFQRRTALGAWMRTSSKNEQFPAPYYGFSEGELGDKVMALRDSEDQRTHLVPGGFRAERRLQPQFNSLLLDFDSVYEHSEVCLVVPGDTSDCAKRLWDAMLRGCLPAFVSEGQPGHWPVLPFADRVDWASFGLFFHEVNSTSAAQRVLGELLQVPEDEFDRRRDAMRGWLPQVALERRGVCGRSPPGAPNRSRGPPPTALELALEERPPAERCALARMATV